jgi:thioredoxin reductase (NADPH)
VKTEQNTYLAKSVILATGVARKTPAIKNITQFEGKGVSYCAICDAFFYRKKDVAVIGAGEYALHEARELSNTASSVTILTNGISLDVVPDPQFRVITTPIQSIDGTNSVSGVTLQDGSMVPVSGVFVAVGIAGSTSFARTLGAAIDGNKIVVDEHMATNIPGLYACGDATGGLLQIAKAVYEGAVAGLECAKHIRLSSQ